MSIHRLLLTAMLLLAAMPAHAQPLFGRLTTSGGVEANGPSTAPDVSGDGRVMVFASGASNWAAGSVTGGKIVAFDFGGDTASILSTTSSGTPFNSGSVSPAIANDGRFVVFGTQANNLGLPVATSGFQVVRKDRSNGQLALVSSSASGQPASGTASGQARDASVSGDGRFVAFRSDASNLLAGVGNGIENVFVKDMQTGGIELVTRAAGGGVSSFGTVDSTVRSISADGRYVLFQSAGSDLVPGFAGGAVQVFMRDRSTATTSLVSVGAGGVVANSASDTSAISPNGRFVSFRSFATNLGATGFLSRIFVRDLATSTTSPVPLPTLNGNIADGCGESDVSNVGTVVMKCFFGSASNQAYLHVPGATDTPFLLSNGINGGGGNQESGPQVAVNGDGLSMVFESRATNLVENDNNLASDIFVVIDESTLEGVFADGFE